MEYALHEWWEIGSNLTATAYDRGQAAAWICTVCAAVTTGPDDRSGESIGAHQLSGLNQMPGNRKQLEVGVL
jgi:hypothetical protein